MHRRGRPAGSLAEQVWCGVEAAGWGEVGLAVLAYLAHLSRPPVFGTVTAGQGKCPRRQGPSQGPHLPATATPTTTWLHISGR